MYEELVRLLKDKAECYDYDGWVDTAILMSQAAEAIEELRRSEAAALANCADEHNRRLKLEQRCRSVPPHGRLIDADEFLKRAIGTKCFRGDYALMLEELVGESTTIIPAEGEK